MHGPIQEPLYFCILQNATSGALEVVSHKDLSEFKKACADKKGMNIIAGFAGVQLKLGWKSDLIVEE